MGISSRDGKAAIIIRSVPLQLPVRRVAAPAKERPTVGANVPYVLIRLEEYEKLVRCGVCETSNKTKKRVLVRNTQNGQTFFSGLDCVKVQFGLSESDLDASAKPLMGLAVNWLWYVSKTEGLEGLREMDDVEVILTLMADFFSDAAGFNCPANDTAEERLQMLKLDIGGASRGVHDDTIGLLLLLVGLHHDYRYMPNLLDDRLRAWNSQRRLPPPQRAAVRLVREDLRGLTWKRLEALHAAIELAHSIRPPSLHHPELPPHEYPDRSSYQEALFGYMRDQAAKVSPRSSHMAPRRARAYLRDQLEAQDSELKKRWRLLFSVATEGEGEFAGFDMPPALRSLLSDKGFRYYVSQEGRLFTRSTVQLETGSVRQMQRRTQLAEADHSRGPDQAEATGYFRGVAVWKPDRYEDVYSVWHAYGGVPRGKQYLDDPLSAIRD